MCTPDIPHSSINRRLEIIMFQDYKKPSEVKGFWCFVIDIIFMQFRRSDAEKIAHFVWPGLSTSTRSAYKQHAKDIRDFMRAFSLTRAKQYTNILTPAQRNYIETLEIEKIATMSECFDQV